MKISKLCIQVISKSRGQRSRSYYCYIVITERQISMLAPLPCDEYGHQRTLEIRDADKTLHRDQSHVEELFLHLDGIQ